MVMVVLLIDSLVNERRRIKYRDHLSSVLELSCMYIFHFHCTEIEFELYELIRIITK